MYESPVPHTLNVTDMLKVIWLKATSISVVSMTSNKNSRKNIKVSYLDESELVNIDTFHQTFVS